MMEEENLPPNIPPSSPDQNSNPGCRSELTRAANSYSSSAVTVDDDTSSASASASRDVSSHRNANCDAGPSMVWTDEKHRSYLDSLEATFVNQLYSSIVLRNCLQEIRGGSYSSGQLKRNIHHSVHQTCHFTSPSKQASQNYQDDDAPLYEEIHVCRTHHGSIYGSIEVSDQNFVDEDGEEKLNCQSTTKKLKSIGARSSK